MKNLNIALSTANLRPKERIIMLIKNTVSKDLTGKEILTKNDKYAIGEDWKAKNDNEVLEWNKYRYGWKIEGGAKLDAQTIYLNAELSLLEASRIVDYMLWIDDDKFGIVNHNKDGVLDFLLKNSGLEYDDTIHKLSFSKLSEELKADILALCPDAMTERQYLDQEEEMARLFNNEEHLNYNARKELTESILKYISGKYAEMIEDNRWWFSGYYAELSVIKIAEKWATCNNINYSNRDELVEKIIDFAKNKKVSLRELLKDTITKWLDNGLFINEYAPLCKSDNFDTCNDIRTKNPHKKVLEGWIKSKNEAKEYINKMVIDGQLEIEVRNKNILNQIFEVKVITGESLYFSKEENIFTEDFKKQVSHFIPLCWLIIFLQEKGFLDRYSNLLVFKDIYKKLSKIYETDLAYTINPMIDSFKKSLEWLVLEIKSIADKLTDSSLLENINTFPINIFVDDMVVSFNKIEPKIGETETFYINEFKEIFGDEFDT